MHLNTTYLEPKSSTWIDVGNDKYLLVIYDEICNDCPAIRETRGEMFPNKLIRCYLLPWSNHMNTTEQHNGC